MQTHIASHGGLVMAGSRSPAYFAALKAFEASVQRAANKRPGFSGTEAKGKGIMIFVAQGRKTDKIMLGHVVNGQVKGTPEVLYFVDIASGNVFGPKSPIAANPNW